MRNFFERRDPWGHSPAVWVVAAMVFLAPLGWWSLEQLGFRSDVAAWRPAGDPQRQALDEFRSLFPGEERIVISWDDSSLGDPRVDQLVRKFNGIMDRHGIKRDGLQEVADVVEPKQLLQQIQADEVEPQEAARRLHGVILGAGPLKVKLTNAGRQRFRKTRADLGKAIRHKFGVRIDTRDPIANLAILAAIPAPLADSETDSPLPAAPAVLTPSGQLTQRESVDHDLQLVWAGMAPGSPQTQEIVDFLLTFSGPSEDPAATNPPLIEECFFVIGAPVALSVGLSESGLADTAATLESIRAAAESVGIPRDSLHLGGSVVSEDLLNRQIAEAAWNSSAPITNLPRRSVLLLALLACAATTFLMLRRVRLAACVLATVAYATCLSLAVVAGTGGSLNIVLLALPPLVLTITLCGAFRIVDYWKQAAVENPATAIAQTSRAAYGPCIVAGLAIVLGLAALCLSPLQPIRDFGLYGAISGLISLAVVLYGMPAMLSLWPSLLPARQELEHRGWRELARRLTIRPTLQALSLLLICGACAVGLTFFRTETKTVRYFREKSAIVQDFQFLEDQIAGIVPVKVLVRFDPNALDQANFLQRMELVRSVEERLRGQAEITGCLSLADFQAVTEMPPPDSGMIALSRFHKRALVTQGRLRDGELPGAKDYYRYQPLDDSRAAAWERGPLGAAGEEVWQIAVQANVMSQADYTEILAEIDRATREVLRYQPGAQHLITGTAPLALKTQQAALVSLMKAFGIAFALMLVVFLVHLRDMRVALVMLLPNLLPITVVFGVLGWCGQRVDLGMMLAITVAIVLAAEGTLHLLTTYRRELSEGISRHSAIVRALEKCGPVMWQTRLPIACGFVMLLFAELPLIQGFGGMAAALTGLSLLTQIVMLPQLLAGPAGRWVAPLPQPKSVQPPLVHSAEAIVPPAPHAAKVETPSEAAGSHPRGSRTDGA